MGGWGVLSFKSNHGHFALWDNEGLITAHTDKEVVIPLQGGMVIASKIAHFSYSRELEPLQQTNKRKNRFPYFYRRKYHPYEPKIKSNVSDMI